MNRGLITLLVVLVTLGGGVVVYTVVAPSRPARPTARTPMVRPRRSMVVGDVSVTMKSGAVDRGANVEVLMIVRSEDVEREWQKEVEKFASEYRAATVAITDSQSAYRKAEADTTVAHDRRMEAMTRGDFDSTAYEEASHRANVLAQRYDRLVADRGLLLGRHEAAAIDLLRKYSVASTRTDVDGHFQISGMKPGKYWIFVAHRVFDDRFHWLVAIELNGERTRKLDFSRSNEGWPISATSQGGKSLSAETNT